MSVGSFQDRCGQIQKLASEYIVHFTCNFLTSVILRHIEFYPQQFVFLFREVGQDESEIRVGFVTYAKEIHFYNVKVGEITSIANSVEM